jgi:hypothetical protein
MGAATLQKGGSPFTPMSFAGVKERIDGTSVGTRLITDATLPNRNFGL